MASAGAEDSTECGSFAGRTVPSRAGQTVNVATTAAWSVGAGGRGLGSSSIDGRGVATTISMAGMLSGLTSRWDAKTWSISSPRPRYTR
jgi:hypothetical protein